MVLFYITDCGCDLKSPAPSPSPSLVLLCMFPTMEQWQEALPQPRKRGLHVGVQGVATKVSHVSSGPETVGVWWGVAVKRVGATIDMCDTQRERMRCSKPRWQWPIYHRVSWELLFQQEVRGLFGMLCMQVWRSRMCWENLVPLLGFKLSLDKAVM